MTEYKPFATGVAEHDRGHVAMHNDLAGWLQQGGIILSGAGLPTSANGEVGDFYLDTTSAPFVLYGPKGVSGWPAPAPIATVAVSSEDLADAVAAVTAASDVSTLKAAVLGFLGTLTAG